MLGFVLGTSEGRAILSLVNNFTSDIFVSTATKYGGELLEDYKIKHLNTEPLDTLAFVEKIREYNITLLVDSSHPYAKDVSKNLMEACEITKIEYIRYERMSYFDTIKDDRVIRIDTYEELLGVLKEKKGNILNTTGSNNANLIESLGLENRILHRVLPSPKILQKLIDGGIKIDDIIAIKGPFKKYINDGIIKEYNIKIMITKDSGIEGGTLEKVESAFSNNVLVIVINKPKITYGKTFNDINKLVEYIKARFLES